MEEVTTKELRKYLLKYLKEEVNLHEYKTFKEARRVIFEFIESWYNNQRIHSSIGYITPNQKYNNYIANLAIA